MTSPDPRAKVNDARVAGAAPQIATFFAESSNAFAVWLPVPSVYHLRFPPDVLGKEQDALAEVLEPSGDRPARVQFWVDQDVATAQPNLMGQIRMFSDAYADRFTRVGNVQHVTGGEEIKNDIHVLERMLKVL